MLSLGYGTSVQHRAEHGYLDGIDPPREKSDAGLDRRRRPHGIPAPLRSEPDLRPAPSLI